MRNLLMTSFVISIILISSPDISAQSTPGAVEYLNQLFAPFENIDKKKWAYLKVVTKGRSARKIDKKRQKLIAEIKDAKVAVRGVRTFKQDTILKNGIREYLKVTNIVLEEEYNKILDMEDIAEQSYDAMEAYLLAKEKAGEKMDEAFSKVLDAQEKFCEQHKINLIEGERDKRSKKIENASQLLSYYNKLYLIYFKAFKEEAYVMAALSQSDIAAIEQHNNTLMSFSEEGIDKLKSVEPFRGDTRLSYATKSSLNFYKREAEKDISRLVDFYVNQDNFEKIQKKMDRKKKKDRTKEDIDAFNKAAADYNKAAGQFNQIIASVNKARDMEFKKYSKAVDDFFDRHN